MKIKDTEYGFSILPNSNKVLAELFKVVEINSISFNIQMLSKEFGSIFRKPIEVDYIKARAWADAQMEYIRKANL